MAPNNPLPIHGNEKTMNLNTLILTNIQSSPYFKVNLFELKTYHQVIDEIYYKVEHLEPWEKGSRKTAGQTGMCGGVRGVGAGGIVSSAYCLLYKLFTLKLTKKQVIGLITHQDSPYIRGLGFMYVRYTQNPADLWEWYEPYLEDDEELDVKAGGGHVMMIGEMIQQWMTKLEWYSTLFPRIPVPIQKQIENNMRQHMMKNPPAPAIEAPPVDPAENNRSKGRDSRKCDDGDFGFGEAERVSKLRESPNRCGSSDRKHDSRVSPHLNKTDHDRSSHKRSRSRERHHEHKEKRRSRSRDKGHKRSGSNERHPKRSRSRDRQSKRSRSHERQNKRSRSRERISKGSRSQEKHGSKLHDRHSEHRHSEHRHSDHRHSEHRHSKHSERSHHESRPRDHRESSFDRDLRRERERVKNGR